MSVVIVTPEVMSQLRKLKENALLYRFSEAQMQQMIANKETPIGDREGFSMQFPGSGLRVVLSFEEQPVGWCWHFSVSTPKLGKYPPPTLIRSLLADLDIHLDDLVHSHEETCADGGKALNFFILDTRPASTGN